MIAVCARMCVCVYEHDSVVWNFDALMQITVL